MIAAWCVVTVGDAVSFFHADRVGGRLAIEGGLLPKYSVHIHTTEERHRLQGREGWGNNKPHPQFIRPFPNNTICSHELDLHVYNYKKYTTKINSGHADNRVPLVGLEGPACGRT